MSKTLIQNGATERIELLALNSSGVGVTADASNISISIRNNANGQTFNGTVFAAGANVVNPTETDSVNRPGEYHYDFTSPTNDISVSVYATSSTASVISDPWGPDTLQIGGLPTNFEDLSITSATGYITPADASITSAKFAANAITSSVIAANAIGASQIATDAITSAKIAADAIGSSEIAAGAITAAKFAASAIDSTVLAASAIGASQIAPGAITSATFAASAINASAIATDAITAAKIAAGAITSSEAPALANLDVAVSSVSSGSAPSAATIADAVWDEAIAGHLTAGSTGSKLNTASSGGVDLNDLRDAVWNAILSAYEDPESAGYILQHSASAGLVNAIVEILVSRLACESPCGVASSAAVVPTIFVGHKGESIICQVYRNNSVMTDAQLVGATSLKITFKNLNGAQNFIIASGVQVGAGGTIVYTTVASDGVDEAAGTWEYQASGVVGGKSFESQKYKRIVKAAVPEPEP